MRVLKSGLLIALLIVGGITPAETWVDGTPLAFEIYRRLQPIPPIPSAPKAPPRPGERREFFAIDFKMRRQYVVSATLRSMGKHCYIFVEDSQWNRRVTPLAVEILRKAFEERASETAGRGIYEIVTSAFGDPPDIDKDTRIYILILDIPEPNLPRGEYIGGYFSPVNQERGALFDPIYGVFFTSNEVEMIYLDCNPQIPYSKSARSTLAHELQHLIHWRYDPDEELWVNEGCSMLASYLCGYLDQMKTHLRSFESNPSVPLTSWPKRGEEVLANYGAVFLWSLYLYERFSGQTVIKAIVRSELNGIEGIESALNGLGFHIPFKQLFSDWKVANLVDDPEIEGGKYGYRSLDVRVRTSRELDGRLEVWQPEYVELTPPGEGKLAVWIECRGGEPDVRIATFRGDRVISVGTISTSPETGVGRVVLKGFGSEINRVVVMPSFSLKRDPRPSYRITYRFGGEISFETAAIPNPIHPCYWEIIAIPSVNPGSDSPYVSVLLNGRVSKERLKMKAFQRGKLFAVSLFIHPDLDPRLLSWRVYFLGKIVGEGKFER